VLFLHVTSASPRQTALADEKYPRLLVDKGFTSVPTLCFMTADGTVLLTHPGDQRAVVGFAATFVQAKRFAAILAQGDSAAPADRKELFLSQLCDGVIAIPDIQRRADMLPLDGAEKAHLAARLVDYEAAAILRKGRANGREQTAAALAALVTAGKNPSVQVASMFWILVFDHSARTKEAGLAQRAFGEIEQMFGAGNGIVEVYRKKLGEAGLR
jgi:hypothetical protein